MIYLFLFCLGVIAGAAIIAIFSAESYEKGKLEGHSIGYEKGYKKGYKEGAEYSDML